MSTDDSCHSSRPSQASRPAGCRVASPHAAASHLPAPLIAASYFVPLVRPAGCPLSSLLTPPPPICRCLRLSSRRRLLSRPSGTSTVCVVELGLWRDGALTKRNRHRPWCEDGAYALGLGVLTPHTSQATLLCTIDRTNPPRRKHPADGNLFVECVIFSLLEDAMTSTILSASGGALMRL